MFKKSVNITTHGEAINPQAVKYDICRIWADICPEQWRLEDLHINSSCLLNYYLPSGEKVTSFIQKLARKQWGKKVLDFFPKIGQEIAKLYQPKATLTAFWLKDKRVLGEGELEHGETCFNQYGCNHQNKKFIVINRRFQSIVIQDNEGGCARAIIFFAGGRTVYIINEYFDGMQRRPKIFVEALRRLLGFENVIYKMGVNVDWLPIYVNNNRTATRVVFGREFDYSYKFRCFCGKYYSPETGVAYKGEQHQYILGCCDAHAHNALCIPCTKCGEDVIWAQAYHEGYKHLCEDCSRGGGK